MNLRIETEQNRHKKKILRTKISVFEKSFSGWNLETMRDAAEGI